MAKYKVTLVGCGMIGTALGLAVKTVLKDAEVIGHDKDQNAARRAEKLKAIDKSNWNLPSACENAHLIILAIPQDAIEPTIKAIVPDIMEGAIITDTCSLKSPIMNGPAGLVPPHAGYISSDIVFPPHRAPSPSSIEAITPDIFKGAIWTLTPRASTQSRDIDALSGFAAALGATPIFMDATEHDGLRLAVDVLPSTFSSNLMLTLTGDEAWRERKWLAGGAFEQVTRPIEGLQEMELANAMVSQPEATLHWINQFMLQLMALRDTVRDGQTAEVQKLLLSARDKRDQWLADWRRGRSEGQPTVPIAKPSLLGSLLGDKLASSLRDGPKPPQPPSKSTKP